MTPDKCEKCGGTEFHHDANGKWFCVDCAHAELNKRAKAGKAAMQAKYGRVVSGNHIAVIDD